jgi:Tfp pilus assembly protein FimT
MLVVIVMIGILVAIAFPRLDSQKYRLDGDVRSVSMTLAYAQRLAVSLQHNVLVTIDKTNHQLRAHEDKNNDGAFTADERVRVLQLEQGVNFERNGAPDVPSPVPQVELLTFQFMRDGSTDVGGMIFMSTDKAVATGDLTHSRAVELIRATGRPTWYRFRGGVWVRGI